MKLWQKAIISVIVGLFISLVGGLALFNPLSVSKVAGCAEDCVERTVTRHQNWVVDGNWTCPSGWALYWSDSSDKWRCKKGDNRQDATRVDTSHWGSWSSWSTNSCTPSPTKNCENKVQHKIGDGGWVDGNCPSPSPTSSPEQSVEPSATPTENPSPSTSPCEEPSLSPSPSEEASPSASPEASEEPSPSPSSSPEASTSTESGAGGTSTTTTQTTTQETQGQVLGASTLPATGTFPENIMAVIQLLGFTLTGAGISAHAKGKKN